jgi:hypothetical protein
MAVATSKIVSLPAPCALAFSISYEIFSGIFVFT